MMPRYLKNDKIEGVLARFEAVTDMMVEEIRQDYSRQKLLAAHGAALIIADQAETFGAFSHGVALGEKSSASRHAAKTARVNGDFETANALAAQHKKFEQELIKEYVLRIPGSQGL